MAINITQQLIDAGTKYKKELLTMPVAVLSEMLQFMTLITGLQGKEVGGSLTTDAELRPYCTAKDATDNTVITAYELSLIHISEPTRLGMISYAVFCLKK